MTKLRLGAAGWLALSLAFAWAVIGCGGDSGSDASSRALRLGYFANVTHAPALVAIEKGFITEALGPDVTLELRTFNAGPEAVEAIFSDALDIAYVGPNPAINAFAKSNGVAVRIIAGATSGGAALVVKPEITSPAQLKGKKLATPQRGNTQDVALRAWLEHQGLQSDLEGGGDVSILPQPNAQTLETFRSGEIQGAWVPEPWTTRLMLEGGGSVLVDERTLWPDGKFVTTHVIVRTAFLEQRPEIVAGFLRAHVRAIDFLNGDASQAREIVNAGIERLTGKALPAAVIEGSWQTLVFTLDPIASSLRKSAQDATEVGLLDPVNLDGIYALGPLNAILAAAGKPQVSD
jgi:NitT/TauT family transport system substrate-binding protein